MLRRLDEDIDLDRLGSEWPESMRRRMREYLEKDRAKAIEEKHYLLLPFPFPLSPFPFSFFLFPLVPSALTYPFKSETHASMDRVRR